MCDARLLDGSRVNVAVRPVAIDGPLMSIRKFSKKPLNLNKLVDVGALRPQMAELLAAAVRARVTLIISGGTGSGKTTMLNALSPSFPKKSACSPSRTLPNCNCSNLTSAAWRRGRRASKAKVKFASAIWSRTRCACGLTRDSW